MLRVFYHAQKTADNAHTYSVYRRTSHSIQLRVTGPVQEGECQTQRGQIPPAAEQRQAGEAVSITTPLLAHRHSLAEEEVMHDNMLVMHNVSHPQLPAQ